jgi:hypothetical protein
MTTFPLWFKIVFALLFAVIAVGIWTSGAPAIAVVLGIIVVSFGFTLWRIETA